MIIPLNETQRKIFAELDWEDTALSINPYGALGSDGVTARYGGSVHFTARLAPDPSGNGPLKTFLLPPKRGTSCKLARRFGSDRILRLRVGDVDPNEAEAFLRRPMVLENHVFELLLVKDVSLLILLQSSFAELACRILRSCCEPTKHPPTSASQTSKPQSCQDWYARQVSRAASIVAHFSSGTTSRP